MPASDLLLSEVEARAITDDQIRLVTEHWYQVADDVGLAGSERRELWRNRVLNPFAFYGDAAEAPGAVGPT